MVYVQTQTLIPNICVTLLTNKYSEGIEWLRPHELFLYKAEQLNWGWGIKHFGIATGKYDELEYMGTMDPFLSCDTFVDCLVGFKQATRQSDWQIFIIYLFSSEKGFIN